MKKGDKVKAKIKDKREGIILKIQQVGDNKAITLEDHSRWLENELELVGKKEKKQEK